MSINIQEIQRTPSKINSQSPDETHYNQTFKGQTTENIESSKREVTCHIKRIFNKINNRFFLRNLDARR